MALPLKSSEYSIMEEPGLNGGEAIVSANPIAKRVI